MRLMRIVYTKEKDVERLKTCLDMCAMRYVVFHDYDFVDGDAHYTIFIDKAKCKWNDVMREVNRVHPVPFKYVNNMEIKNGVLYEVIGTQNFYPASKRIWN